MLEGIILNNNILGDIIMENIGQIIQIILFITGNFLLDLVNYLYNFLPD